MKTNAARLLDSLGIHYELREYEVDPDHLEAELVAQKIGLPPEQVFKTLVARGDRNGVCFAVVPANTELDEKALARCTGDRKAEVVPLKEVQPLTGYVRGGVTALAPKRPYPVFVEETVELFDVIAVSAGVRGTQILLHPGIICARRKGWWERSRGRSNVGRGLGPVKANWRAASWSQQLGVSFWNAYFRLARDSPEA